MKGPLKVAVSGGKLSITIGVDTLTFAFENCPEVNQFSPQSYLEAVGAKITNPRQFALDVLLELVREDETGTTMVHRMLDAACKQAVDNGSTGTEDA